MIFVQSAARLKISRAKSLNLPDLTKNRSIKFLRNFIIQSIALIKTILTLTVSISCYEGVTRKIELIFSLFMLCRGLPSSQIQKYHSHKLIELGSNENQKIQRRNKMSKIQSYWIFEPFYVFKQKQLMDIIDSLKHTCNMSYRNLTLHCNNTTSKSVAVLSIQVTVKVSGLLSY